jgi:hypothetical protein
MSISEWATTISGVIAIFGVVSIGVRFLIKHYLREMKLELTNNGGGSMKDKVDMNTERLHRVETRVDDIYKILCDRS